MSDDFAINPNWNGRDINTLVVKKFNPVPITPKNQNDQILAIADAASMLKASDPTISGDKALELATKLVTGQDVSTPAFPPAAMPSVPGMAPMYPGYINPAAYGLIPG